MPNRLAAESSPYLLQHQHNPVDWFPWGEEALGKARAENKPVFLSIGYAACHWCHVMEHESFEDDATAAYLNENFVSIKVDREERPDLDQIYMNAVTAITGHGGWPMTVFLMPDGRPFHGGTYFPPEPRYGMPSFLQLLRQVYEAWVIRRDDLDNGAQQLVEAMQRVQALGASTSALTEQTLSQASRTLAASHDRQHGGWGTAPKFPQPMALEFLLRRHVATGEGLLLDVVERSLTKMARGGIYDHLGGGFHRYSVDAEWLAPHFEKMLYDNAQLARAYLHAWQVTGNSEYRDVVEATLDYVTREMTHPAGGFFSTQDADSEGEEGKFFVWSIDEVNELLGDDAPLFRDAYDVSRNGNWEGKTILRRVRDADVLASLHGLAVDDVEPRLAAGRAALFARREPRIRPGLDDKVLTAWNGLMLATLADAARVLDRADYRDMAVRAGEFALRELRRSRWPAVAHVARWSGQAERLSRGLCLPRVRPGGALPNDVRPQVVLGGARAGRRHAHALRRSRGGILRHERRPRDARDPAEGRAGQRDAFGERDGGNRAGSARRPDGRAALCRCGWAGAAARRAIRRRTCRRIRTVAVCGRFRARGRPRSRHRG